MTQVTLIRDLKGYLEPEQVERLIADITVLELVIEHKVVSEQ